jgi:hypothetical protein
MLMPAEGSLLPRFLEILWKFRMAAGDETKPSRAQTSGGVYLRCDKPGRSMS